MSYFLYYNALTAEIQILFCDISYKFTFLSFTFHKEFRGDMLTSS